MIQMDHQVILLLQIGWHSWELDVEDSVMETWIRDAIYYYNINSEG